VRCSRDVELPKSLSVKSLRSSGTVDTFCMRFRVDSNCFVALIFGRGSAPSHGSGNDRFEPMTDTKLAECASAESSRLNQT
jgi:hypothetical protein